MYSYASDFFPFLILHELQYLGCGKCLIISDLVEAFLFFVFQNMAGIEGKFTKLPSSSLPAAMRENQAKGISAFHVFLTLSPFTFLFIVVRSMVHRDKLAIWPWEINWVKL